MVVLKVGNVRMLKIGLPVLGWSTCSSFTDRANWSLLLLICQFYLGFSLFGWINWCLWIITLVWNMLSKASGAIGILEYPESLKVYCGCLLKCRDCSMVLTVSSSIGMKIFFPCLFVVVGRMCVWETLCETTARVRVRLVFSSWSLTETFSCLSSAVWNGSYCQKVIHKAHHPGRAYKASWWGWRWRRRRWCWERWSPACQPRGGGLTT